MLFRSMSSPKANKLSDQKNNPIPSVSVDSVLISIRIALEVEILFH